jgi:hypothetical protein
MKLAERVIQPYAIEVPESNLNDLHKRLENTRWSEGPELGWDGGTDRSYLRDLCDYWRKEYNWRGAEQQLNQFAHYLTEIDGVDLHFVYERGKGSALLTDPVAFGLRAGAIGAAPSPSSSPTSIPIQWSPFISLTFRSDISYRSRMICRRRNKSFSGKKTSGFKKKGPLQCTAFRIAI